MKIVVTHLTRMQRGYVCVAGLDPESDRAVRPVIETARLSTKILARHGGPFDLATMVDLGATEPIPNRPEVEDHTFSPRDARLIEPVAPARFWDMVTTRARPSLAEIFGPDLKKRGGGAAVVEIGSGSASLGYLAPSERPELYVKSRDGRADQVRMIVADRAFELDLGVTDIRLYGSDHVTPDPEAVRRVSDEIANGTGVVLSVGLTRPYTSAPDRPPVHWLQVNNVHLESDPAWRLGSEPGWRRLVRLIFDF